MRKRTVLVLALGFVVFGFGVATIRASLDSSRTMTFEECERAGGTAWMVDLSHPNICPSCAAYEECAAVYNDYREVCPECYGPCQECQERYSVYESCPECYGPCQTCENEYRHDFESDEERYRLCPACANCDRCREEVNAKRWNCPPCASCRECKEEHSRYEDIGDVCPEVDACLACWNRNWPYPDQCPGGKEKIGEISDAAIWFQCCR